MDFHQCCPQPHSILDQFVGPTGAGLFSVRDLRALRRGSPPDRTPRKPTCPPFSPSPSRTSQLRLAVNAFLSGVNRRVACLRRRGENRSVNTQTRPQRSQLRPRETQRRDVCPATHCSEWGYICAKKQNPEVNQRSGDLGLKNFGSPRPTKYVPLSGRNRK